MSRLKKVFKSHKARTALALLVIGIGVVLAFYAPKEPDPNIGLVNDPETPTVGVTQMVGTLDVNRGFDYRNIHLTVARVQEAGAFSDDRKLGGVYTVRVYMHEQAGKAIQEAMNVDYAALVSLVLPGGQVVGPKLVSLLPVVLPGQASDGFFDFPVAEQVALSSLTLRFDGDISLAFAR